MSSMNSRAPVMAMVHVLDVHLFIESLAFIALHIDDITFLNKRILPPELTGVEKILMLIEKIALANGVIRRKERGG